MQFRHVPRYTEMPFHRHADIPGTHLRGPNCVPGTKWNFESPVWNRYGTTSYVEELLRSKMTSSEVASRHQNPPIMKAESSNSFSGHMMSKSSIRYDNADPCHADTKRFLAEAIKSRHPGPAGVKRRFEQIAESTEREAIKKEPVEELCSKTANPRIKINGIEATVKQDEPGQNEAASDFDCVVLKESRKRSEVKRRLKRTRKNISFQ